MRPGVPRNLINRGDGWFCDISHFKLEVPLAVITLVVSLTSITLRFSNIISLDRSFQTSPWNRRTGDLYRDLSPLQADIGRRVPEEADGHPMRR